jgi:hypothetical protein
MPVPEGILGWEPNKNCCSPLLKDRARTSRSIAKKDTSSGTLGRTNAYSASPSRFLFLRPSLTCGGKSGAIQTAWFERARCCDVDERRSEPAVPERDGRQRCGLLSSVRL